MFGDDLQKVLPRQVVARFQIDDLDLAPITDEPGDVLQRNVVAGLRVVEPAACVAFDQQGIGIVRHGRPPEKRAAVQPKTARNK